MGTPPDDRQAGAATMGVMGGLGVTAATTARAAADRTAPPTGNWRVDMHAHFYPPVYYDYMERHGQLSSLLERLGPWELTAHLKFMNQYRIQATVFSFGDVAVSLGDVEDRRATASAVNDYAADLIAKHGDRFSAVVIPPMPNLDGTLDELARGLDTLGLEGIALLTNYQGVYLGDPSYDPLYRALNDRGAFVFVHPTGPPTNPAPKLRYGSIPSLNAVYEYTFDTTRAITSLIYNGVLSRYPRIRWQFVHAGGTLPFLMHRLSTLHAFFAPWNKDVPEGPARQMATLYFDTAQAYSPAQMLALRQYVPLDHIVFGSDFPPVHALFEADNHQLLPFLDNKLLPDALHGDPEPSLSEVVGWKDRIAIERTNALSLLPRLASRIPQMPGQQAR